MANSQRRGDGGKGKRLQKILSGAFAGPPTPLKDIPTKEGESRKLKKRKKTRRRAQ